MNQAPKFRLVSKGDDTVVKMERAGAQDVEYWLREWLREAINALHAHMEVYQSNPGGWDQHSSHAALQRVVDDLTRYTLDLVRPVPTILYPERLRYFKQVLADYLELSKQNVLVREGYADGDTAKYAKLLTGVFKAINLILKSPSPKAVYDAWRKAQR